MASSIIEKGNTFEQWQHNTPPPHLKPEAQSFVSSKKRKDKTTIAKEEAEGAKIEAKAGFN